MAEQNEPIESLPLIRKRRILGIIVPLFNVPFFALTSYQTALLIIGGMPLNSEEVITSVIALIASLGVGLFLPWWSPVYTSSYTLEAAGLKISRLLRGTVTLPYKNIARAEVYIREPGDISEDALNYTKDSSAQLRKLGFSFVDFTNAESNIVILMVGRKVYMISPAKPRAFLKSLKRRAPKLTAKIVELNAQPAGITGVKGMLSVDKSRHSAFFLVLPDCR